MAQPAADRRLSLGREVNELHEITIERVGQEPLTVRRGDTVMVWFSHEKQSPMTVIGISPTRRTVRVASPNAVRSGGFEVDAGMVYPMDA